MLIARSFDINKPGTTIKKLKGGIIGGSILNGEIKEGEEIEISPGVEINGKYTPVKTKTISLSVKEGIIKKAESGGLVGIGTLLDPSITKGDNLIGNIAGKPGTLPPIMQEITIKPILFEKVIGLDKVKQLQMSEPLVISIGTTTTVGTVIKHGKNMAIIKLKRPICAEKDEKIALSRKGITRWCLIGYGVIQ